MKKAMLLMAIGFVVVTISVFFIYPYLRYTTPVNLEGAYIRYAEHEFGKEWDTLVIKKTGASRNGYHVVRRWKYERVLDSKVLTPEYKRMKTSIQFLEDEGLFVEEESGIRYSFNNNKNELLAGTTIYKKIK
ncbi:MAG TPA: hypothetical protein VF609_14670 [Flavisolibacter sp.]|jgi:hypothetical protein